jgi:FMN phosphatase YigB (HAD superfamily)
MSRAVSLDLFGTLVEVERPGDPTTAIASALRERGVDVPGGWSTAFAEPHVTVPEGGQLSLVEHVVAALRSRDRSVEESTVADALRGAFDTPVRTRKGAPEAVVALAERYPVGLLSNCSLPGLAERTLEHSAVDPTLFATVTTSVGCGWRKPDPRAFKAVADGLCVPVESLVHVGDDPATDGEATDAGAEFVAVGDGSLADLPEVVEARWA